MSLTTVAVGIDRSSTAANALRWAVGIAGASGASVRAVGTWQMPFVGAMQGPIEGIPTIEVIERQCAKGLEETIEEAASGADVERVMVEGRPGPTLLDAAADADLLVVGRTGYGKRHGIARFAEIVLGSTARHCVHHAQIPVAAVPSGASWVTPATVVVGLDGSENSKAALRWAIQSLPEDTEIHAVRAFAPWVGDGLAPADLLTDKGVHDAFRHETQQLVDRIRGDVGSDALPVASVEVDIGNPRNVLVDQDYPVDLIVVGERGHTGVTAMVLGSVADHLVRYANCPVVVVPDGERSSSRRW